MQRSITSSPPDGLIARVAIVAAGLMLLWMARALAFGEVPLTGDLLHTHYPIRDFYARALTAGQRFDWMPSLYGGFDLIGEGQVGGYHPVHWLWYRFLPLDVAFVVEMVAAYPLMFAGTWLFLRRWCDRGSAAFGALLFTFCGFSIAHGVHPNMVSVMAHLPWLLWCIHGMFAADTWSARAGLGAAIGSLTGSQILLGHPQALWLSGIAEGAYTVFLFIWGAPSTARAAGANAVAGPRLTTSAGRRPRSIRRLASSLAMLVAAKLLGLVVGAIQLIATFEASALSTRANFDANFPFTFSMPPLYLLLLLSPYQLWGRVLRWTTVPEAADEVAIYGGAITLTLAVWWIASLVQRRRRGASPVDRFALAAMAFAVLGLLLALGRTGGIYYLQTLLPVVGRFRAPLRFVVLTQLALACLSAVAMMQLMRANRDEEPSARRAARWTWTLPAVSAAASIWLLIAHAPQGASPEATAAMVLGPALFACAAALVTWAARGSRVALAAIVLFTGADLALYGLGGVVAWHDFETRAGVINLLGPSDSLPPTAPYRVVCCPYPNLNVLAGYRTIDAYLGLVPERQLDYRTQPALRLAQVGYAHRIAVEYSKIPDAVAISDDWFRLPEPVARARLVRDARVTANVPEDLATIDVEHSALVTHDVALSSAPAGTAMITRDEPGAIDVRTTAEGRQLLVVSEMFNPGWRVTIDGTEGVVERVNADFLGAVVPAGEHDVELMFRPRYRSVGGPISLAGGAVCLALGLIAAFFPRVARAPSI